MEGPRASGADPFASYDAKVVAWERVAARWRFYEDVLDSGSDRQFYPSAARRATTTSEILALLDSGFVPDTATEPVASSPAQEMWVAVTGPQDWAPDPGFSLEIGYHVYSINANNGGGVTSVNVGEPTIVRLRRLPDCEPIVRIVGRPGGRYVVRMSDAGTPHVEDWTGRGLDSGPALSPGPRVCGRLRDTATSAGWAVEDAPRNAWVLALAFLISMAVMCRRPSGRPRDT
jgi:hypothetical protein